ncbi:MAG: C-GCAxxG-C-C family protein [Prevotella sp.]|jgi:C_GCAxxG_C_C family probable redox protein
MKIDKQARMRCAEEHFMQGFNCSQSVAVAFADVYGYTEEQMLRVSAGFGAGIGRMRMSCGAFNALALLAGLDCGSVTPGDREGKSYNYKIVQQLAARFKEEHGSLICSELLKLKRDAPLSYEASERTAEYYQKRPCVRQIISAARIYAEYLEEKERQQNNNSHERD